MIEFWHEEEVVSEDGSDQRVVDRSVGFVNAAALGGTDAEMAEFLAFLLGDHRLWWSLVDDVETVPSWLLADKILLGVAQWDAWSEQRQDQIGRAFFREGEHHRLVRQAVKSLEGWRWWCNVNRDLRTWVKVQSMVPTAKHGRARSLADVDPSNMDGAR